MTWALMKTSEIKVGQPRHDGSYETMATAPYIVGIFPTHAIARDQAQIECDADVETSTKVRWYNLNQGTYRDFVDDLVHFMIQEVTP